MKRKADWKQVVWKSMWVSLGTLFALALPQVALATSALLPWEGPLCQIATGLTGVTAFMIATIAFVAAAAGYLFGEQLSGILKGFVNVIIAVALMIGSSAVVNGIAVAMGKPLAACGAV